MAAICVVVFHLSIVGAADYMPAGNLAVDLFFALSGFVIAHSYGSRPHLGAQEFITVRAIRLLPLSILGLLLGLSYFLARLVIQGQSQYSALDAIAGTAFNLFLLPKPWMSAAPTDTTFPVNTPLWSLSFQFIINIVWVMLFRNARPRQILAAAVVGACALAVAIRYHGHADLGATWPTFIGGGIRCLYAFLVGLLIHAYCPRGILPWWTTLVVMAGTIGLCTVSLTTGQEIVAVVAVMPALFAVAVMSEQRSFSALARLGDASFALYVTHVPVLMIVVGAAKMLRIEQLTSRYALLLVPVMLVCSYAIHRYFDEPVRARLKAWAAWRPASRTA